MRIRAEQLHLLHRPPGEGAAAGDVAEERVRHHAKQFGSHRQIPRVELIDIFVDRSHKIIGGGGNLYGSAADIANFQQRPRRDLTLDVELPVVKHWRAVRRLEERELCPISVARP